jgi:hypothetical protein
MKTPFLDSECELLSVEEQLIELSCDSTFKILFSLLPLLEFRFQAKTIYPEISKRTVAICHYISVLENIILILYI